jgi:hypothetical protein
MRTATYTETYTANFRAVQVMKVWSLRQTHTPYFSRRVCVWLASSMRLPRLLDYPQGPIGASHDRRTGAPRGQVYRDGARAASVNRPSSPFHNSQQQTKYIT